MISYDGNVITYNDKWIERTDPYNPLNLPPYTIRLLYKDGVTPTFSKGTAIQISSNPNIWDLTYNSNIWASLLFNHRDLLEVLGANSKEVRNMFDMFSGCTSLNYVQLFDTHNAIDVSGFFYSCIALTSIPLFDTSKVTNMNRMFRACVNLTSVPLFDTSNVTDMSYMFMTCGLTTVPLFDTSKVTRMPGMFYDNLSLTSVPLFDTSNVTDMNKMFWNCEALTSIPLFDTSKVTNMDEMFEHCRNVESGALALYQQASTQTNPPTNHTNTFSGCGSSTQTGAAELAQIPSDWK